jgi:hypothetical protein
VNTSPGSKSEFYKVEEKSTSKNSMMVTMNERSSAGEKENIARKNYLGVIACLADLSSPRDQNLMSEVTKAMQHATESGAIDWQDWNNIEAWLKNTIKDQSRPRAELFQAPCGYKAPKKQFSCGLPAAYLRTKGICVMWNLGCCQKRQGHNTSDDVDTMLKHECGLYNYYLGLQGELHGAWRCPKKSSL